MKDLAALLREEGIITLAVIDNSADAPSLAQSLRAGGLNSVEVALRTPDSLQAIRAITQGEPELEVLAGTVLTVAQAEMAVAAGAVGLVSPGFSHEVSVWCSSHQVPYIPGVATATEIMTALDHGHHLLKFFPAGQLGGLSTLSALEAPFSHHHISFMMTGGMKDSDLEDALSADFVSAVGGSWIAPKSLISSRSWAGITDNARNARETVVRIRPQEASR